MKQYAITLRKIIDLTQPALNSIDEKVFNHKPAPNKWSKKEILGHLIDSAYNNHQRFLRANSQENLVFQGYNQTEWVTLNNYQHRNKKEVIDTWITVNRHLGYLMDQISQEAGTKLTKEHNFHLICMTPIKEDSTTTLSYLIWDYLFHLEHHLKQILPNYSPINEPFNQPSAN